MIKLPKWKVVIRVETWGRRWDVTRQFKLKGFVYYRCLLSADTDFHSKIAAVKYAIATYGALCLLCLVLVGCSISPTPINVVTDRDGRGHEVLHSEFGAVVLP